MDVRGWQKLCCHLDGSCALQCLGRLHAIRSQLRLQTPWRFVGWVACQCADQLSMVEIESTDQ